VKAVRRRTRRARPRLGRRAFLETLPALAGAAAVTPTAAAAQDAPEAATRRALPHAETLIGLELTDADRDAIAGAVARNADSYRALRGIDIPHDVDPTTIFQPHLPSARPRGAATPNAPITATRPAAVPPRDAADALAFAPLTVLAALLERRTITSTALTRLYLDRLKRHASINCVVTLTEDLALAQAAAADRELSAGRRRGPLHGIPWGAKDLFATRGVRTTWGARPFEHQTIDADATVVERLRAAGAVLVAKLAPGALARGGTWFGGTVRNPWNPQRAVNASSAGPGAATAGGLVPFALCSETRGSIISTSSPLGIAGLRPTFGRVSRHGLMIASWSMDKVGCMCRGVEDCALVLNAIYGPDGRDETVADAPFLWKANESLAGLKIGYVRREFEEPPGIASADERRSWPAWRPVWQAALDAFRSAGAVLEPIDLPSFPAEALQVIQEAEGAAAFDDETRTRRIDLVGGGTPASLRAARFIPAVEYIRAQRARRLLMREMDRLMGRWDAFLSPPRSNSLTITSFTGHPALVVNAGFANGLPIGLMVTGKLYDEATVLRVGLAFERATRWHTMHPALA
jgi:Asp-tRNA(Asn)/Glu-tRNA(Gln) amidotransferase A subunit family amidase